MNELHAAIQWYTGEADLAHQLQTGSLSFLLIRCDDERHTPWPAELNVASYSKDGLCYASIRFPENSMPQEEWNCYTSGTTFFILQGERITAKGVVV